MSISLEKNQSISLAKADGTALTKVVLGLGWDAASKKSLFGKITSGGSIDLDASAILLDTNKNVVDTVWFNQLDSRDGSIKHAGDNLTGDGDGDDEKIDVDLAKVSANVQTIVLVVASFQGQTFDKVENVFARVVDSSTPALTEVVRYDLRDLGAKTASIVAKLTRSGAGWTITALGVPAQGRTAKDLIGAAKDAA